MICFLAVNLFSSYSATSNLTLSSNYNNLVSDFNWAKTKALSYVFTGRADCVVPSYCAAMQPDQWCTRDVAHQVMGGHLLGLDNENFQMINTFAWGGNRRHEPNSTDYYWPRWQYLYNVDPLTQEALPWDPTRFFGSSNWRTLPVTCDMLWRAYQQYLWTGDSRWISGELLTYYHNVFNTTYGFYVASGF